MTIDEFNKLYSPFYLELEVHQKGILPADLSLDGDANSSDYWDNVKAIVSEHSTETRYYLQLLWKTLNVEVVEVSSDDWNQEVPQELIKAMEAYQPPDFDIYSSQA